MPSVRAGASNIASAAIPPASSPGWSRSSSSQFCRSRKKGAPPPPAGDSAGRRKLGRNWVHAALAVVSRFLIDLRLGPRTLESAAALLGRVAGCCVGQPLPLFLVDNHLPYPAAILQVFGRVRHGRRRR